MDEIRNKAIVVLRHFGLLESANAIQGGAKVSEVLLCAAKNPLCTPDQKSRLTTMGNLVRLTEICQDARKSCEQMRDMIRGDK